ncbi:hypothetical protein QYM36_002043 [Artemia franciscana]|uniref:Uncharacterized protein n=1 Tax=Artemia franciscana TaxID=6661 RepID=A0AA88IAL2_ARTSF|nr:hypothetical protein QYM36_002043 [Artemia franciscana]
MLPYGLVVVVMMIVAGIFVAETSRTVEGIPVGIVVYKEDDFIAKEGYEACIAQQHIPREYALCEMIQYGLLMVIMWIVAEIFVTETSRTEEGIPLAIQLDDTDLS